MEIAVALIGLVGAGIGLVAACVPRRERVVHQHELRALATSHHAIGPGRIVARATLFGFSIGMFFGVLVAGSLLAGQKTLQSRYHLHDEVGMIFALTALVLFGLVGTVVGVRVGLRIATLTALHNDRREAVDPTPPAPAVRNGVAGNATR
jgi:hypothetical protein